MQTYKVIYFSDRNMKTTMEKQIETKLEWQCIGHNPSVWALGSREGGQIVNPQAVVSRESDGQWRWRTQVYLLGGIEPSRLCAMQAAARALDQIAVK